MLRKKYRKNVVAPHAGAWIETGIGPRLMRLDSSPPTRGRGLKLGLLSRNHHIISVSPPTRGRGLKLVFLLFLLNEKPSPPTRGRGLKHDLFKGCGMKAVVAPHAGAWIET